MQHTYRNVSVIRSVVRAMAPFRSDAIVLVVSNPVDLLTSIAQECCRLPKFQVFGSGTLLDSVRLRGLVADKVNVSITTFAHPFPEKSIELTPIHTACFQFGAALRRRSPWRVAGCCLVERDYRWHAR